MGKNTGGGRGGGGATAGQQAPASAQATSGGAVTAANPAPPTPTGVVAALEASPGARNNFVTLADLRDRLGGTRAEQDVAIRQAIREGRVTLEVHEGNVGNLSQRMKDAAIRQGDATRFVYIMKP